MGIFNLFNNKNNDKEENDTNIAEETVKKDVAEKTEKNNGQISNDRAKELLERIFKDEDHGQAMMIEANLSENIFILGYIENIVLKNIDRKEKEQDYLFFKSTLTLFRKIFYDKILNKEELWKVVSKTTMFPFLENGYAHFLVCDENKEEMISNLKKLYYEVDIIKVKKDELKNEFKELCRLGFKGILFSNGKIRPYGFTLDNFIKVEDFENKDEIMNPETQYAMITFFQEMRRNVNYEGADKIRRNLENMMIYNIINTKFIVPIKEKENNQIDTPIYIAHENKDDKSMEIGLYVFTDKVEMDKLEEKGIKGSEGWKGEVYDINQVMTIVESQNISEICINYSSICFRLNKKSLDVLKEGAKKLLKKNNDEKVKENWEVNELPILLKDKNIPLIRDTNNKILFKREENKLSISTFILSILTNRKNFDEIMEFFLDDEKIEELIFYDINNNTVNLKLRPLNEKSGLYLVPMRYDDENHREPVEDTEIHYTEKAAIIKHNRNNEEIKRNERNIHFYTISNNQTSKTYIPLFSDRNECEKIFAKNNYRCCMTSYEDVIEKAKDFDGIVINPLNMSIILEKKYLDRIYDIEMNI